jgi:purine-binding chemotaxis protein CheW
MSNTIRQLSTFSLAGEWYGVEVDNVHSVTKCQELTRIPLAPPAVAGMLNLRGQVTTAIDMRVQLDLPPREADAPSMNVVVYTEDGLVSLLVDEVGDVENTSDDDFEDAPETLTGAAKHLIKGAYKMADRQLLLALDVSRAVDVTGRMASAGEVPAETGTTTG